MDGQSIRTEEDFHVISVNANNTSNSYGSSEKTLLMLKEKIEKDYPGAKIAGMYWKANKGSLSTVIDKVDIFSEKEVNDYCIKAKERIETHYLWDDICRKYCEVFENR